MAKEKINLRNKLRSYKFEFDLLQKIPCSKQENKEYQKILEDGGTLPNGVFVYDYDTSNSEFYTIYEPDLTESERQEYLVLQQLSLIRTIKNCVMFFTILTIISMIAYVLIMLNTL